MVHDNLYVSVDVYILESALSKTQDLKDSERSFEKGSVREISGESSFRYRQARVWKRKTNRTFSQVIPPKFPSGQPECVEAKRMIRRIGTCHVRLVLKFLIGEIQGFLCCELMGHVMTLRGPFLWCVRCGTLKTAVCRSQHASVCWDLHMPVCTGNTSTCSIHVDVLPVHTGRFESTHGGGLGSTHGGFLRDTPHTQPQHLTPHHRHHTTTTPHAHTHL